MLLPCKSVDIDSSFDLIDCPGPEPKQLPGWNDTNAGYPPTSNAGINDHCCLYRICVYYISTW